MTLRFRTFQMHCLAVAQGVLDSVPGVLLCLASCGGMGRAFTASRWMLPVGRFQACWGRGSPRRAASNSKFCTGCTQEYLLTVSRVEEVFSGGDGRIRGEPEELLVP